MSSIRALQREDIPQVASLYESVMRSGSPAPPARLGAYFERTFLDHPWADASIPSLVYETAAGEVVGFLGSHVRRLRLDSEPIHASYTGQLVTAPAARKRGVGTLLLRRHLAGPQHATLTDGATPEVRRMWEGLGGDAAFLQSLAWVRFFRPFRFAGGYLPERMGRPGLRSFLRPGGILLDSVATRAPGAPLRAPEPRTQAERLTPGAVLEHLPSVAQDFRLYPDYDREFVGWLFDEMPRVASRGDLVRRLVRDEGGQVLGWYVAYLQPGGMGHVQQVAATSRTVGAVLDHLFHHAWRGGCAALRGRLEPLLFEAVRWRHCHIRHDAQALVHSPSGEVSRLVLTGRALLTRMEGEWWMGHHIEPFA